MLERSWNHVVTSGVFAWTVLLVLFAPTAPAMADPLDDFAALEMQMEMASEDLARGALAMRTHGATSGQGPDATPIDVRPRILERMDAIAAQLADRPDGAAVAVTTLRWSLEMRDERALDRFCGIVARFPDAPGLAEVLDLIQYVHDWAKAARAWTDPLRELAAASTQSDIKLAALYAAGQIHLWTQNLSEARTAFEKVIEMSPDSRPAAQANKCLYEIDRLQVGMPAPNFTTTALDGKSVSLESLRGKVVLLNFWGTFCPTCIVEIPRLQAVASQFADRPFEIVAVSCDDDRSLVQRLIRQRHPPGIQTWEPGGRENPVAALYNVQMFPTWYVIDTAGVIRARDPFGDGLVPALEAAFAAG